MRKRISLTKWKSASTRGNLLVEPLTLGDLFNPATFINALRQQTARQLGTAIDRVKMICSWDKDAKHMKAASCPLLCHLSNLLLQGASFHSGTLQESASEANELTPAPNVCIGFVAKDAPEPYNKSQAIGIPVFLNTSREEFLMELQMPTPGGDQGRWVLAGVALFLSESE